MDSLVQRRSLVRESEALRAEAEDAPACAERTADRIAEVDGVLRAFVAEPDRARRLADEAGAVAARWPEPGGRPPLYGVPVAVKDIVRVDGLPTRAGSALPAAELTGPQAPVVDRLRRAGAVIAGKTVTAEFALSEPGPTRNPHGPGHTPGGSSSGSAAAVAAGMVPLALGTQTIGSVIRPAAYCGVTGYAATRGRIPSTGIIPNAPTFDTVGLFADGLRDVVLAAAVLLDGWRPHVRTGSRLPVLGIPDAACLGHAGAWAVQAFQDQVTRLLTAGFRVHRTGLLADFPELVAAQEVINRRELARVHAVWFARYGDRYRARTAAAVRAGQAIDESVYRGALRVRETLRERLGDTGARLGVDLWLSPAATGPAPEGLGTTGDPVLNLPWSMAGAPALTLPAGRAPNGLPLGLQCAAAPGADEHLLAGAAALEPVLAAAAADRR